MKCAIEDCRDRADPDGGYLCKRHAQWTDAVMQRCCRAIETAISDENGLDGSVGERLLKDVGHWRHQRSTR